MKAEAGSWAVCATAAAASVGCTALLLTGYSAASPLAAILGACAAIGILLLLWRAILPAFATILIIYLPRGIIDDQLYSALFDTGVMLAAAGFLLNAFASKREIAWCPTTVLMVLFLVWCFITTLWAYDITAARRGMVTYIFDITLLFLLYNLVNTPKDLAALMRTLAIGGWLLVVGGAITLLVKGYTIGSRLRIFDLNENLVPTMLIVGLIGALWVPFEAVARWKSLARIQSIAFLILAMIFVLLSGSRVGVIAFGLVICLMLIPQQTRRWGAGGLAVALVAVAIAPSIFTTFLERAVHGEGGEFGGRAVLWESGFLLLKDNPLGAGIGNGKSAVPQYLYSLGNAFDVGEWTARSTHNPLLDVGVDSGFPGMLLYSGAVVAAISSFVRACFRSARSGASVVPKAYYVLVACGLAGFFICWVRDGAMNNHPLVFVVIALLLVPSRLIDSRNTSCERMTSFSERS